MDSKGVPCASFFCVLFDFWFEDLGDRFSWRAFSRMTKLASKDRSGINWEFRGKLQKSNYYPANSNEIVWKHSIQVYSTAIMVLTEYENSDIHQTLRDLVSLSISVRVFRSGKRTTEFRFRDPDVRPSDPQTYLQHCIHVDRYRNRISRTRLLHSWEVVLSMMGWHRTDPSYIRRPGSTIGALRVPSNRGNQEVVESQSTIWRFEKGPLPYLFEWDVWSYLVYFATGKYSEI
jgi:hypothetical protein